ncbi:MAG: trigger factor [Ruminococcus sp.]|uniref:trigger factor n=1 Tax=Ruminococcus sp. TaxID=41978 RepID=UPI0028738177|nr:trigger factor [Ruminococcus sp.]MBQ3284991.1 trigger factor [Ruminococcus sp.]
MALKSSNLTATNTYELEVEVDGKIFMDAVSRVFKKQAKKIAVPGFRKGKAPRAIIERIYGEDVFYDDAMQDCYPDALDEACQAAGLKVVAVTGLEATLVSKEGFTFKATVVVEPEIEIKDYDGIEVEKLSTEVTEEMIDEEIDRVRERNSRMVTVEDRAAENGDTVVIDFEGFVDGEAFEGGKAEEYNLELGSGNFIPGFEEQLVGHNTGDEFTIDVKFPEEYQAENLKGKDAQFKIKLHEIKKKELPEVDDDFVKDVSEKDTVAEYRDELKEQIQKRLDGESERDLDDKLTNAIIEKVEGEIPVQMIENEAKNMVREMDMRLRQQGMDFNTYMKYTGMDASAVLEMNKPEAERRIKMRLALEKIAELEKIEPTDEEVEEEYAKMAEIYKMDVDKVKEIIPEESLKEDLRVQLAMKHIKDNAVIK